MRNSISEIPLAAFFFQMINSFNSINCETNRQNSVREILNRTHPLRKHTSKPDKALSIHCVSDISSASFKSN